MFDELIVRLEQATDGSRELDTAIFGTVPGLVDEESCRLWCTMDRRTDLTRDRYLNACAPRYTASIDSALTLVPAGSLWCIILDEGRLPNTFRHFLAEVGEEDGCHKTSGPIAMCIAALKARTAMKAGQALAASESEASPQ